MDPDICIAFPMFMPSLVVTMYPVLEVKARELHGIPGMYMMTSL